MSPEITIGYKIIEPSALRWIGQNYNGLKPERLVIAGMSIRSISEALGFTSYKIGRFRTENTFICTNEENIFYVYINPNYKYYRTIFSKVVGRIPDGYDVDHVQAKNLARYFNYKYVLMCMIPASVNRKHGRVEKIRMLKEDINIIPDVCFLDDRIYDKILSRNPEDRRVLDLLLKGYNPESLPNYGLTLKQKGIWNSSFGFHLIDKDQISKVITPIHLDKINDYSK